MQRLPQVSERQPFPRAILPCPDILVGGRLIHFVEQWGENNLKQMSPLYRTGWFQDTIQFNSPSFDSSDKCESIFLPLITKRDSGTSPEMGGQWKGYKIRETPGFYSWLFLVPKTLRPVIDLSLLNQCIKKQAFKMETVKSV